MLIKSCLTSHAPLANETTRSPGVFYWTSSGPVPVLEPSELELKSRYGWNHHAHSEAKFCIEAFQMATRENSMMLSDLLAGDKAALWCPSDAVSYQRLMECYNSKFVNNSATPVLSNCYMSILIHQYHPNPIFRVIQLKQLHVPVQPL